MTKTPFASAITRLLFAPATKWSLTQQPWTKAKVRLGDFAPVFAPKK
jgi:hypothetical protein